MANAQALSPTFLLDLFSGIHNFATDVFMAALYKKTANVGAGTSFYTAAGEVTGLNYVAGGVVVPSAVLPKKTGSVVYWTPSASITFPNVTISALFDAVLLYNASKLSRALGVWKFSEATVAGSDFLLQQPPNSPTQALIRARQVA